jgi:hypothetical protein
VKVRFQISQEERQLGCECIKLRLELSEAVSELKSAKTYKDPKGRFRNG